MTQEEKSLLLQDLCARLSYGVCVHIRYKTGEPCYGKLTPRDIQWFIDSKIENVKPYLRTMSSMTEEEEKEYMNIDNRSYSCPMSYAHIPASDRIDWLNAHHFDYHNLIAKGLALEAPKDLYLTK